jgi:AIM21-like protein
MAAPPAIPQRPMRSSNIDIPTIPARPRRNMERSLSPNRDSYARSPLNDPAFKPSKQPIGASNLGRTISKDLPPRPPSVNLPTIGQEGAEYAQFEQADTESDSGSTTEQKKSVAGDLPLHAPKASLPISAAKSRIQAVTRTDSNSAAAAGIGKPSSERGGDANDHGHALSRSASSQQHSRPSSIFKPDSTDPEEQGIPEIGMQIPLYPNAGDVQAPTPAQSMPPPATGVGFFNKGDAPPKHHFRTKSGREVFTGPPGSYGLRIARTDPFEKAWYEKHPAAKARQALGEYGPKIPMDRKEYNLSSAELNKIIHEEGLSSNGKMS